MPFITKQFKFCAAHKYWNDDWSDEKNYKICYYRVSKNWDYLFSSFIKLSKKEFSLCDEDFKHMLMGKISLKHLN